MKKRISRILSVFLSAVVILCLAGGGAVSAADEETGQNEDAAEVVTDLTANNEGLWLTEIYTNDVDRSSANDESKRTGKGYEAITTFGSTEDLMDYIEVVSTHSEAISLNDTYEIYCKNNNKGSFVKVTVTTMDGSSDITIEPGQAVVIWNVRDELDAQIPTEAEFRAAMNIPDDALVLKAVYYNSKAKGYDFFSTCEFKIVRKSDSVTVSEFYCENEVNVNDGLGVELSIPDFGSEMEVYRNLTTSSAGYVYSVQLNGLVDYDVPDQDYATGVYITEINANDINRSSAYGTASDVMECIEIINTTDHDVDLNADLDILYCIKEGFRELLTMYSYDETAEDRIGSSENCILPAGATAVLWAYRYNTLTDWTSFPTEEDFREAFGIDDDVYVFLFIEQNLNDTQRTIQIYESNEDGSRTLLSSYSYLGGGVDLSNKKSVKLSVNPEGPEMLIYSANTAYTIGTVDYEQYQYFPDDGSRMGISLYESLNSYIPGSVTQGDDYRVYWSYTESTLPRTSITTYYRFDGEGTWYSVSEATRRVPGLYETTISADEIYSHEYMEFYVALQNTYHRTLTSVYRVEINQLNDVDGIRTNISDGDEVSGSITITANDGGDNAASEIYIDGVKYETTAVLENGSYLTFDTQNRDTTFYNALTTTDNEVIASLGKWQYMSLDGMAINIDSSYYTYNKTNNTYDVTLRFWAGTKGATVEDYLSPNANREDFAVTELAMWVPGSDTYYLPTEIGPSSYNGEDTSAKTNLSTAYDAVHSVGDSAGWCPYMDVSFSIPASAVNAVGAIVDTTKLTEGEHTLKVTNGDDTTEVTFIVDNTAPVIDTGITNGSTVTGNIKINPVITEANTLETTIVVLDGEEIEAPYETTAYTLGDGEHELSVYAEDAAGNYAVSEITFTVDGSVIDIVDAGADDITQTEAELYLTLSSSSDTNVTYYQVESVEMTDIETTETDGILPYITYTLSVEDVNDEAVIYASWNGEASNSGGTHASRMYVLNTENGAWDLIGSADSNGSITQASFTAEDHVDENGEAVIIVQCTASSSLPQLDTATDGVTYDEITWDGYSVPEDYDFCFAWETDTQYYAEEWQQHYLKINNWIVDNADELGIAYVMHTGDIVDDQDMTYQWVNADEAMSILDNAGISYGVLGGNHDVAASLEIYENYYEYFGADRFEDQETYGASYEDNLGHYDLISQGGQDFIIVYMSWNIYQDEIDWINSVLSEYSDRMAILCFHTYTNVTESDGTYLDYFGQMLQENVVAENENVFLVLNGHYHGSSYETTMFDDDGDGEYDRTVYQICTDYQSGFEGGNGYLKLLYFDLDNDLIYINSYSPSVDDFNYFDTEVVNISEEGAKDTGVDPLILKVDFDTAAKTILAKSFSAYVSDGTVLGTSSASLNEESGNLDSVLSLTDLTADTTYYWYAVAENETTGYVQSSICSFTTAAAQRDDTESGTDGKESEHTHSYAAAETKEPTASQDGYIVYTCTGCGDTYTEVIAATGTDADGSAAETGDTNNLSAWIAILILSAVSICCIVIRMKKSRRTE